MATINERLATLEAKSEEINKNLWRCFEAIHGNGKPGLVVEIRELSQLCKSHFKSHETKKLDWQWIVTTIVAIGAVAVSVIIALIK